VSSCHVIMSVSAHPHFISAASIQLHLTPQLYLISSASAVSIQLFLIHCSAVSISCSYCPQLFLFCCISCCSSFSRFSACSSSHFYNVNTSILG